MERFVSKHVYPYLEAAQHKVLEKQSVANAVGLEGHAGSGTVYMS